MNLQINERLSKINVLSIVDTLMNGILQDGEYVNNSSRINSENKGGYYDIEYLNNTNYRLDYVRDFVYDYYEDQSDSRVDTSGDFYIDDIAKNYIINRLYLEKGRTNVISVMTDLLKINYYTSTVDENGVVNWISTSNKFNLTFAYNFPRIELFNIEDLNTRSQINFLKKLYKALDYLLFYTSIKVTIDSFMLNIGGKLINKRTYNIMTYRIFNTNRKGDGIDLIQRDKLISGDDK